MVSRLDLLRRVPLFSMLTTSQAVSVADAVVRQRHRKGEAYCPTGEKIPRSGDDVGEMSLSDQAPHSASVVAGVQTDTLVLDQLEFARCLPGSDSMAYAVLKGMVHRLRQADRKIESLALMDVYGRVAGALLDFAGKAMSCVDGAAVIRARTWRKWSALPARWSAG